MIIRLMSNSAPKFIKKTAGNVSRFASLRRRVSRQKRLPTRLLRASAIVWCAFATQSHAQPSDERCLPELIAPLQSIPAHDKLRAKEQPVEQNLEADELTQPTQTTYQLLGHARLKQPGLVVLSDQIHYDKTQRTAEFIGHVELHQPDILITAEHANLDEKTKTSALLNTQYQMLPSRVHGVSERIDLNQTTEKADLNNASLTTCKRKLDQSVDWDLTFDTLQINNQRRRVIGKNTTLYFKKLPIFYTPYFDYPLDDRASGFLFPEFGNYKALTQEEPIHYLKVPYFFNIAPNMDDTLTTIPMTKRGLVLDNEFRYLAKQNSVVHTAELDITLLQDQLTAKEGLVSADNAGNLSYGDKIETRWRASLDAKQNWGQGLSSAILWHATSDENLFADLPIEPSLKTVTQTQRHINVDYRSNNLHAYAQLLSYLRLRNAPLNYEKRPEIGVDYRHQTDAFSLNLQANATEFVMPISEHSKPEALRIHLEPSIEYQLRKTYGGLKAILVANQTQYQMHDNGYNTTGESTPSRFIPQFALKGDLVFERQWDIAGQNYTQTLEPAIQYLYVPFEDQSKLPLFDTANRSLAFSNLFELNRFSGSDRIGDANQVASALTTRLLNDDGQQLMDAGIGQIHYLNDRQVTLTNTTLQTEAVSDLFVKMGANFSTVYFSATAQLDHQDYRLTNANSRLKWQPNKRSALLLNHLIQNQGLASETQVLNTGGYTQISSKWQLGAYANYDLKHSELIESNLGVKYDSCCWSVEMIAEHTQLENGLYNDGVQFQFELKGISSSVSSFRKDLSQKLNF